MERARDRARHARLPRRSAARERDRSFYGVVRMSVLRRPREICKHIWAALLEAERRGLLGGEGTILPDRDARAGISVPPAEPARTRQQARRLSGGRRREAPVWETFPARTAAGRGRRRNARVRRPGFSNGEIVYSIDVRDTLNGFGTVLNVLFRQRRKNGAWSKREAANLTPSRGGTPRRPDDREILSLLLGAGNPWSVRDDLRARLLPVALRAQRTAGGSHPPDRSPDPVAEASIGSATRQGFFPFAWDDGPPWRFDMQIAPTKKASRFESMDDSCVTASGSNLRDPVLLLSRGFLFTRNSDGPARGRRRASPGLHGFEASAPSRFRVGQSDALVETVARSGLDPRALPSELRYDVVEGTPRPRVRVGRPERQQPVRVAAGSARHGAVRLRRRHRRRAGRRPLPTTQSNRRLIRRDGAAEQAAIDRLHELGFRYTWSHFESRQLLGSVAGTIPASRPHAGAARAGALRPKGGPFRSAVNMRLEVSSGIDWFDLHGAIDFGDGPLGSVSAAARGHRARRRRRRARRWERGAAAGGMAAALRGNRGFRHEPRGQRFGSADRRSRCSMRCWRRSRRSPTTRRLRECGPSCTRSAGFQPRIRRTRFTARCASTSARRSAGLPSCGAFSSAAAWPTTWGSARPSWCWRCSTRDGRRADSSGASAVDRRRSPLARVQLARRGGALRAEVEGRRLHGRAARRRRLARRRPRADDIRNAAARRRASERDRVRLRDPRRSAGHQECRDRVGEVSPAAARPPSPGAERHADRESSRRAVEPLRVPESGAARIGEGISASASAARTRRDDDPRLALARAASVHPSPDERAGGARAAATHRTDAAMRARAGAAAALRRAARALSRNAAGADCTRRRQPIEDADPRGAAAAATGGVSQRLDRPVASARAVREIRRADPAAARGDRRGAQGARLLTVHEPAGAPAATAGRAGYPL